MLVKALENIGIIYNMLSLPDSALIIFKQAENKAEALNEPKMIASIYANTGYAYELKQNYNLAKTYYEKALNIRKKNEDADDIASSLNNLGRIFFLLKDYSSAINHINESNKIAVYIMTKIDNFKILSDIPYSCLIK